MRLLPTIALLATLLPGLSMAQTASTTIQSGDGNNSTTVQSGVTDATTIQVGDGNIASTTISGTYAASAITQWGSANQLEQTVSGNNQGLYTQQIGILNPGRQGSMSLTGGNLRVVVTVRSELK